MGTVYIDGQPVPFEQGDNVLQAALKAGIEAPHFCYHEALGSAGACRLCAMEMCGKNAHEAGRIVMSCTQPASDGQNYKYQSPGAHSVQKGVVEYLMTRHPHDCPVCDEAGACQLQDMTIIGGHRERRYDGKKVTYPDQMMGPLIWHTANRCITCYRCVRFYQDYALGDDFGAYGSSNRVSFRRAEPGAFDSPFSGNLIDLCPTGTFTDKVYRRSFSRTWQLEKSHSICELCSVGCHVEPGGRAGTLRRIHPSPYAPINPFFICDRGRFGPHYSEAANRPLQIKSQDQIINETTLCEQIRERIHAGQRVGIMGSVHNDLHTLLALNYLAKQLDAPFAAFSDPQQEQITRLAMQASHRPPSLPDIEAADVVLIVGDLTEAAPMMDLAVRQVVRRDKPVFMLHAQPSELANVLQRYSHATVQCRAPWQWTQVIKECCNPDSEAAFPLALKSAMTHATRIVCLGVADALSCAAIHALRALVDHINQEQDIACLGFAMSGSNSVGAALTTHENSTEQLFSQLQKHEIDTLICCNSDLLGQADGYRNPLFNTSDITHWIVLDNVANATSEQADLLIPLATWPEQSGASINYQGCLQTFERAYERPNVYTATDLVSWIDPNNARAFFLWRDQWIMEKTGSLSLQNTAQQWVDFSQYHHNSATEDIACASTDDLQVMAYRWHGEHCKAQYSPPIIALNPETAPQEVCIHPDTGQSLHLHAGNTIQLHAQGIPLTLVYNEQIAKGCLGIRLEHMSKARTYLNQVIARASILYLSGASA